MQSLQRTRSERRPRRVDRNSRGGAGGYRRNRGAHRRDLRDDHHVGRGPWQDDDRELLPPGENVGTVALLVLLGAVLVGATLLGGNRAYRSRRVMGVHARR